MASSQGGKGSGPSRRRGRRGATGKANKDNKAPAISRAAAVLRLLGRSDRPLRLQAIASELDLVPSTCLYVLRALVEEEFVAFDAETKRYSLEAGVLALARQWLRRNPFANHVQPALDRLGRDFGVTLLGVHIVGLDHIVVVAASEASGALQVSAQVGSRFPALISATGRCIAAFGDYPEEELRARFDTLRWDRPPGYRTWLREVRETRERGYAVDKGNYIAGVTVLAAPVWQGGGHPGHALVAIGIGSALQGSAEAQLGEALLSAARTLSSQLGGEAPAPSG